MRDTNTIGTLLLDRLYKLGLHHIFGIPGDYVLTLLNRLSGTSERPVKIARALRRMPKRKKLGPLLEFALWFLPFLILSSPPSLP